MTRTLGFLSILLVVLLAMAFAAANAGHRTTLSLGIVTLYQIPVTLVAFAGLLAGMVVMLAAGIRSDLKVRRILRERLADESRREQTLIDRNQGDLFANPVGAASSARAGRGEVGATSVPETDRPPSPLPRKTEPEASYEPEVEDPPTLASPGDQPGPDTLPREV